MSFEVDPSPLGTSPVCHHPVDLGQLLGSQSCLVQVDTLQARYYRHQGLSGVRGQEFSVSDPPQLTAW